MSDTKVPVKSSPLHGEHNEDIYGSWLALSPDEIKALKERDANLKGANKLEST